MFINFCIARPKYCFILCRPAVWQLWLNEYVMLCYTPLTVVGWTQLTAVDGPYSEISLSPVQKIPDGSTVTFDGTRISNTVQDRSVLHLDQSSRCDTIRYRYMPWPCVRLCLSQAGVLSKRHTASSWFVTNTQTHNELSKLFCFGCNLMLKLHHN